MWVLAIDPGLETGLVVAEIEPDKPIRIQERRQVAGGLDALRIELNTEPEFQDIDHLVCEKFRVTPRVYRAAEVEALRIEGLVVAHADRCALDPEVAFQYNGAMLLAGSSGSASANKRAADDVLRKMGLWTTGSQIGRPDANDVNSAMKHLVAFARSKGHEPTLEALGVR